MHAKMQCLFLNRTPPSEFLTASSAAAADQRNGNSNARMHDARGRRSCTGLWSCRAACYAVSPPKANSRRAPCLGLESRGQPPGGEGRSKRKRRSESDEEQSMAANNSNYHTYITISINQSINQS